MRESDLTYSGVPSHVQVLVVVVVVDNRIERLPATPAPGSVSSLFG